MHSAHMSSSKVVGGRKVNLGGDNPVENNKAVADPPAVTANLLHTFGFCGRHIKIRTILCLIGFVKSVLSQIIVESVSVFENSTVNRSSQLMSR
ncbi:hypothetical protein T4D_12980 [Trichinella pseudospiralis]|uniref:Uncharacterized protein n=1 Tax=Trichinella pseudospiralis TaxID=6337 RepID=A0A0V1FPU8_TRIPS|nr:hypothetical protein T4D_12980 [Trichinella pseudospiralis]